MPTDSTVLSNQAKARSLGISIPGVSSPTLSGYGGNSAVTQPNSSAPVTTTPALSGDALNNYLNTSFDNSGTSGTIMDTYNASRASNTAAAQTTAQKIADQGNQDIENQNYLGALGIQTGITNSKGLINPGAMTIIQNQSNTIVKQLTQQMNDALANNQSQLAATNADLIARENTNLITARQNFLSQYFNTQQESRAQASFQTPVQSAVLTLAGQYPDAGILPTDDMAAASQKAQNAQSFKNNIQKGQADIKNALAQAAAAPITAAAAAISAEAQRTLAGPQAQYQTIINGIAQGDPGSISSAADQLILNQRDPSKGITPEQLQTQLSLLPGGIGGFKYQQVISQAQAKGYNQAGASLGNTAAETNNRALSSGGYSAFSTGITNLGGAFLQGAGGLNNSLTTIMTGPDGKKYQVPNSKVNLFKQNGYK